MTIKGTQLPNLINKLITKLFISKIQRNLSSVYMALVLSFNLQSESLVIHISHYIHDITECLASLKL